MKYSFQTYDESESNMNHPVLLVQHNESNSGYGSITVRPVWMHNDKVRFYNHDSEAILQNFEITCQWNLYNQIDESFNRPYAFHVGYTVGFDIDHMESVNEKIGFLKKLNKGLGKISGKFGHTESFEDFIIRIAVCMGIDTFVTLGFADETGRVMTPQDVKHYIKSLYTK
jgi:hypothetical protein